MNTPQKEILCIKPDGSFRVGDGVDPMFALGELANAYMKQCDRIKRLEESLKSIREYWNRDNNNRALIDACWYAIDTASEALEAKEAKP
jgi:hypothetical protein